MVCRPTKVQQTGMVTIQVEVSLTDTFAEVSTETNRLRSIPGMMLLLQLSTSKLVDITETFQSVASVTCIRVRAGR